MKDIYTSRASRIDGEIDSLLDAYRNATDGDEKNQILHDIKTLSDIDNNLAKTLVAIEANELKSREISLAEITSNEKHEVELQEIKLRGDELDLRKQELDNHVRETDLKREEMKYSVDKDAADREVAEQKLEVEKQAVLGRVAGEGLKVIGTVVGVVGTLVSLKTVMRFEKMEDGGILPSKLMSLIFKNL